MDLLRKTILAIVVTGLIGIFVVLPRLSYTLTVNVNGPLLEKYAMVEPFVGYYLRHLVNSGVTIFVVINSPGGYTVETLDLIHDMALSEARIVTVVPKEADSAAALMAMAGDIRIIPENATLIFHRCFVESKSGQMLRYPLNCDPVDKMTNSFVDSYVFPYLTPEQQKAYLDGANVEVKGSQLEAMGATTSLLGLE